MIIRGGENVYCVEVETALFEHPAVTDAAVDRHPAPRARRGGRRGRAPGAGHDARPRRSCATFVGARIAAFKVPVRIWFKDDPLPRNPNGKIMKRDLKTELLPEPAP